MPRGVHLLVLDAVEARGGLSAGRSHRDAVRACVAQPPEQAQPVARAGDREDDRVGATQLGQGHARTQPLTTRAQGTPTKRRRDPFADRLAQAGRAQAPSACRALRGDPPHTDPQASIPGRHMGGLGRAAYEGGEWARAKGDHRANGLSGVGAHSPARRGCLAEPQPQPARGQHEQAPPHAHLEPALDPRERLLAEKLAGLSPGQAAQVHPDHAHAIAHGGRRHRRRWHLGGRGGRDECRHRRCRHYRGTSHA